MRRPPNPDAHTSLLHTSILSFVLILVVLQIWLVSATVNAWFSQNNGVIWPAAITSLVCFLLNWGLLLYLTPKKE